MMPQLSDESDVNLMDMENIADKRLGPGILMLSTSMQLIYSDRRAWELCGGIQKNPGKSTTGVLPPAVSEMCEEIIKHLHVRTDVKDWEQFRIKRVLGDPARPVLLCGFGLPEQNGSKSRVLIMLEEIGRRQEAMIDQAKEQFSLTEREITVIENLLKGWTNKEIANELGVTEQTIKEHIKHIMAKTKTTTRTGILVKVLRL